MKILKMKSMLFSISTPMPDSDMRILIIIMIKSDFVSPPNARLYDSKEFNFSIE